jgi:TRAP-type C4-dicarboxylate transport system substrate-binding protein
MKKLFLVPMVLILIAGLILTGCGGTSTPAPTTAAPTTSAPKTTAPATTAPATSAPATSAAPAQAITIKFASFENATNLNNVAVVWIADEVTKATGVKINIQGFYSESMVKGADQFDAIDKGIGDMAWITTSYTPALLPLWTLPNSLPLMTFDLGASAYRMNEYYNNFPAAKAELDKFNVKFIGGVPTDSYLIVGNKRVQKIADIKGYRARTFGLLAPAWAAVGGVPVSMPAPEAYDAMQKGTVDGALGSMMSHIIPMKYNEVAKFVTNPGFGALGVPLIMNKNKWNSLPANVQQAFVKIAQQDMPEWYYKTGTEAIAKATDAIKAKGITVDAFSKEEVTALIASAGKPVLEAQAASLAKQGLPGKEAIDFMANAIAKYEKEHPR